MSNERLQKLKQFAKGIGGDREFILESAELHADHARVRGRHREHPDRWVRVSISLPLLDTIDDGDVEINDPFGDPLFAEAKLEIAKMELGRMQTYLGYVSNHAKSLETALAAAQRALADVQVTDPTEQRP